MTSPKYNILLLGETGVGKSTLINSIANYFIYETYEEAIKANKPICIIPTAFDYTFSDLSSISVLNFGENEEHRENENLSLVHSATGVPLIYSFYNNEICFNIIDVPGTGSTFGLFQDIKNKKLIANILKRVKKIHGIFYVCKPYYSILQHKYLNEILAMFHADLLPNIIFVITNSRGSDYKPNGVVIELKKWAKGFEKITGRKMELHKTNIFPIDNEGYKHQCALYGNEEYKKRCSELNKVFKKSWECSKKSVSKMLQLVCSLKEHDVNVSFFVTETRVLLCDEILLLNTIQTLLDSINVYLNKTSNDNIVIGNLLKIDAAIQKKDLLASIFKYQSYISADSVFAAERIIKKLNYNKFLPYLSSKWRINGEINSNEGIRDYYEMHIHLQKKLKKTLIFSKITDESLTPYNLKIFLNILITVFKNKNNVVKNEIIKLFCYFQQNSIFFFSDSIEEWVKMELQCNVPNFRNNDYTDKFKLITSLYTDKIQGLIKRNDKTKISEVDVSTIINEGLRENIFFKQLSQYTPRLYIGPVNYEDIRFLEELKLLQIYYFKYKASLYYESKNQYQIITRSKIVAHTTILMKAIACLYDCFLIDDCFAFPEMNYIDHNNYQKPKRYYLDIDDTVITFIDIPCIYQNQTLFFENLFSEIDATNTV